MTLAAILWSVAGFLLTIMILSYLLGDTVFFRLAAYLFVGLSAGYFAVVLIRQILWLHLLLPLITGTWVERLWVAVPLALVILLVASQFSRVASAGRIPLAFLIGLTSAIVIGGAVFGTLIPQAQAVVTAFDPGDWVAVPTQAWLRILDAVVMLVGTVGTLSYFHFGRKRLLKHEQDAEKRPQPLEGLSKIGSVFIGITLGAVFAGIFSTALMALIDRLAFLGDSLLLWMGGW